jgi:hypothetical protein
LSFAWLIGTVLSVLNALLATRCFRFRSVRDNLVTLAVWFITDIVVSIFIIGVAGFLTAPAFLLFNVFGLVAAVGCALALFKDVRLLLPVNTWRPRLSTLRFSGPVRLCLMILGAILLVLAVLGYLLPPYAYDELGYHLVSVAVWIQQHRITDTTVSLWANVYPKNAELVYCWLYLGSHSDSWVHLGQWIFSVLGILCTFACGRLMGLDRTGAAVAGTLFFLAPTVILQSTTDYNDVAFTSMFLAFFYFYLASIMDHPDWRYSFLAGISGGLTMGIKSSAAACVGVCLVFAFITFIRMYRRRLMRLSTVALHVCVFIAPLLLLGTYWYLHTWGVYGNPLYPFTVHFFGHTVFRGLGSVKDLILLPNTPSVLKDQPWWKQVWISWTSFPTYYAYDMQIGGLGIQWIWLELPSVLLLFVHALRRRRDLLMVIVPLGIIFVMQPANWWARYTLFLSALGGWSVSFVVNWIQQRRIRFLVYDAVLLLICLSYVLGAAVFATASRRDSNLVAGALVKALHVPAHERTVGSVVFPEYQWVDTIAPSAIIGCTDDLPYVYPLYGRHAEHRVYPVDTQTLTKAVCSEGIQYLMCKEGDSVDRWAKAHPNTFRRIPSSNQYPVYQVQATCG